MNLPFQQIDVFTCRPFLGNPVAVVLDAEALSTEQMQRIACWTNLSETTFVLPAQDPAADYRLRIFDPRSEMPFAGHPTLGSAFAVLRKGISPRRPGILIQECGVGLVRIHLGGAAGAFALEAPPARFESLSPEDLVTVAAALRVSTKDILDSFLVNVGPGRACLDVTVHPPKKSEKEDRQGPSIHDLPCAWTPRYA
jgi:PhzF family phenazine biosynthesis protein